jgi:hypothetical protein
MDMTATHPIPVTVNRIAGHLPADAAPTIPLPNSPQERRDLWQDALAAATLHFLGRLAHRDPNVAGAAAHAIFDLEKTRLRHGRDLAGTHLPKPGLAPLDERAGETDDDDHTCDDWAKDWPDDGADAQEQLHDECAAVIREVAAGRSLLDGATPEERYEIGVRFFATEEYRAIVSVFEEIVREERGKMLPREVGDTLAREFYLRRTRKADPAVVDLDLQRLVSETTRTDGYRSPFGTA